MRFKECRTAWTPDSILAGFCQGRIALGAAQLKCHDTSKSSDAGAFAIYIGKRTMAKIRVRVSDRSLNRTQVRNHQLFTKTTGVGLWNMGTRIHGWQQTWDTFCWVLCRNMRVSKEHSKFHLDLR